MHTCMYPSYSAILQQRLGLLSLTIYTLNKWTHEPFKFCCVNHLPHHIWIIYTLFSITKRHKLTP